MINEYIEKATIAINEGRKNIKKGKIDIELYYKVVEEYFNNIYRYVQENIDDMDSSTLARIHSLESSLDDFIVTFETNLKAPNEVENSDEYLLETIVYFTRKQMRVKDSIDFSTDSLRRQDKQAIEYVKDMCDRLGLLCYNFNIGRIFNIPKNHNVSLVKVDDLYYLVDCTYQQYFLVGQNFKNRFLKSASHIVTCEVGSRILKRNSLGAIELLERGFICFEDKMFEDYFSTIFNQFDRQPLSGDEYLNMIINRKKKNN